MKDLPEVHVCMITYKHENYIKQAVQSVLNQKYDNLKLVISDDNSPDNTSSIVAEILENKKNSEKIVYYKHDSNLGMIKNFHFGLTSCSGKYTALCEGDDFWIDENKIMKQVKFLEENPDFVACFTNAELVNGDDEIIGIYKDYREEVFNIHRVIKGSGSLFPTASILFKNVIPEYPDFFLEAKAGDRALALILATFGDFFYLDEITCAYRKHEGGVFTSIVNDIDKRRETDINNINLLKNFNLFTNQVYSKTINKAISKRALISLLREKKPLLRNLKNSSLSKFLTFSDFMRLIKNSILPKKMKEINEA